MLTDPLSVTYNGTAVSLPRASGIKPAARRELGRSVYKSGTGEFSVFTTRTLLSDGTTRIEILLERVAQDADSNPFTGDWKKLPNRFGFVYEVNDFAYGTSTDIGLLRSALSSFVNSTIEGRLVAGEL